MGRINFAFRHDFCHDCVFWHKDPKVKLSIFLNWGFCTDKYFCYARYKPVVSNAMEWDACCVFVFVTDTPCIKLYTCRWNQYIYIYVCVFVFLFLFFTWNVFQNIWPPNPSNYHLLNKTAVYTVTLFWQ